ncbi:MAG: arginine deiminase family protein, partial [Candidatus Promineifilaceae bacterium]
NPSLSPPLKPATSIIKRPSFAREPDVHHRLRPLRPRQHQRYRMTFTIAIVRQPAPTFADGLTTADLGQPDYSLMCRQHQSYIEALQSLGLEVVVFDPLPDYPDGHFVEDTAVITPELVVITRPGAPSRRGETAAMEPILSQYCPLACIDPPGFLEGGDVLLVEKHLFIGLSERTNQAGAAQLGRFLEPHGYTWSTVAVGEGLHLKSSLNYIGDNTLLVTADFAAGPAFTADPHFAHYNTIIVETAESYAANTLLINDTLIMPSGFPKLKASLVKLGRPIIELDMSESQKMDGGLTCLSLRL